MEHFRFEPEDFRFPLNRGIVLFVCYRVFSYAKPLRTLAGNGVFWRIVLCKAASHLCWKCFLSLHCSALSRFALLLEMHSRVAFRYAKLFGAFAGNAVFWGVFLSRSASHLLKILSLVALSRAKPLCTFGGNALQGRISLRKTASHFCWKCLGGPPVQPGLVEARKVGSGKALPC